MAAKTVSIQAKVMDRKPLPWYVEAFLTFWLASLLYAAFPSIAVSGAPTVFAQAGNDQPPVFTAYSWFLETFLKYRLPFLFLGVAVFGILTIYLWTPMGAAVRARFKWKRFAILTIGLFVALAGLSILFTSLAFRSGGAVR